MKITRVETIRLDEFSNLLWLRLHTDEGVIGLGETFFGARAEQAVHDDFADGFISAKGVETYGQDAKNY